MDENHVASRSHAYALFGDLLLKGITKQTVPIVQQIEDLAYLLPQPIDIVQAAAAHQHVLGMNIFANESFFLDNSGRIGGETTDAVLESYRRVGYTLPDGVSGADHLGVQLSLLSFLCGAQADALADRQDAIAQQIEQAQRHFLQQHILRWVAPCLIAIRRAGDDFYAEVASLILALVAEHWQKISADALSATDDEIQLNSYVKGIPALPSAPDLLSNEKTSLRDIAQFLVTPLYAGIYLSRDAIANLGREQQLPRGFGERKLLLTNLLQSAAQYDQAVTVFQELGRVANAWRDEYTATIAAYPALTPFVLPWQQRAEQTQALLTHMSTLISAIDSPIQD